MKPPFVLAIGSFAVHGTASLKTFITILGQRVLPVPSLMLNGLTNMALVKKFDTPFKELLQSSLDLAVSRNLDLILYIGYLGKAEQADVIIEMIGQYRSHIKIIIADPVSGDHGRTYVPDDIIEKWPSIIDQSNIVFPNQTEIKVLTGNKPDAAGETSHYITQFNDRFPNTKIVVTSIKTAEDTIGIQVAGGSPYTYMHPVLPKNFGGSGDAFLSLFILNHFYKGFLFNEALKIAADQTYSMIKSSIEKKSDDLVLEFD